jgi:hypothetical protein
LQLQQKDVRQEIEWLWETYPVFKRYPSVEELTTLAEPGNRNEADKEAVLSALLVEIKRQPALFPLLCLVFWRRLLKIFWRKVRSCPDPDDLLTHVGAGFYEVAVTYPHHRPGSIGGNLYWDTWKKVTGWQREEAEYREQYEHIGPAHELCMVPADVQESEVFPEEMERYLLDFLFRQVIDDNQYDLLLETEVYRRMTQKEWAEARGVAHATARSWRHRAEQAIREYEKAHQR